MGSPPNRYRNRQTRTEALMKQSGQLLSLSVAWDATARYSRRDAISDHDDIKRTVGRRLPWQGKALGVIAV
jgi:hypothetical protein